MTVLPANGSLLLIGSEQRNKLKAERINDAVERALNTNNPTPSPAHRARLSH